MIKSRFSNQKITIDQVKGLLPIMRSLVEPIEKLLSDRIYWTDCKFEESEYKSRGGFIPYSSNCGGLEFVTVIPASERHGFERVLEFGECEDCDKEFNKDGDPLQCGYKGMECYDENEGHLDAKLRIWFKFEGVSDGKLNFYLYLGGGNHDAPYFRNEPTIFEASFIAKTVKGVTRAAYPHIKALIEKLRDAK